MIDTLILIAKQPVPGRVKTRLTPGFTPQEAAGLAGAALQDTIDVLDRTPARRRILAFDGDATRWLAPGWDLAPQPAGGLDARLCAAFDAAGSSSALLVGMDTPHLRARQLAAFDHAHFDACLGLANDGGYWAIGFRDARIARSVIADVPMSRHDTGEHQLERMSRRGLRVQLLDELVDVDTIDDALLVAERAPRTRFSRAVGAASSSHVRRAG